MSDSEGDSPQPQRIQHTQQEDEDEFEFEQNFTDAKAPLKKTLDKPFDEVHEVSDSNDDSMFSPSPSPQQIRQQQQQGGAGGAGGANIMQNSFSQNEDEDEVSASASMESPVKQGHMGGGNMQGSEQPLKAGGSSSEEESDSEEEGDDANRQPSQAKLYNPADYKHLVVSSEIQDLFEYIGRHKHTDIELETRLKPFIPDYIPAVGEIDAFLKVPRPDADQTASDTKKTDGLGLVVLDEPAAAQSDPTVLELSLRAVNKQVISKHATVGSIEHADKNAPRILKWVQSIEEVHRKKPPPHVHYSRAMPDIEQLMQVWPAEFEQLLKSQAGALPDMSGLECDVAAFARMVCAIMDIPVYDKLTESLHVLFTLYSEFQNHAYFQH